MPRPVTADEVLVQVETHRADVWVPEGLAVEKLPYPPEGIAFAFDPLNGLVLQEEQKVNTYFPYGPMVTDESGEWIRVYPNTFSKFDHPNPTGPTLVHTTVPMPVTPGMQVALSGQFIARTTGRVFNKQGADRTLGIEASIWGRGRTFDAYGKPQGVKARIIQPRWTLQNAGSTTISNVSITLGSPSALTWVTIPAGVDRLIFSIELIDLSFFEGEQEQQDYRYTGPADKYIFQSPSIHATALNPIRVHIRDPQNVNPTFPHPLSSTGYAFRDRARFENITPGAVLTAMGAPGGPAVTLSVYQWSGSRGPLLGTLEIPAGQKATLELQHTGAIDIAGTGPYFVESVLAPVLETETIEQTRTDRYEYTTVTDPVSSISTTLREADLSVGTVRFVSDTIDPQVQAGRRLRICGRHAGTITPLFTATIRTRRLVSVPGRKRQIEISAHDVWPRLSADYPAMFDQLTDYGPVLHALGVPVVIDGVDYTGPPTGSLPAWSTMQPAYTSESNDLIASLLATRNARSAYLFTDRRGRLILCSSLPEQVALVVSDMPGEPGALGYSHELEVVTDSASIVNTVTIAEHLIDSQQFRNRRVKAGSDAPQSHLDTVESTIQTVTYRDEASVDAYGPAPQRFPVVRGTGNLTDVANDEFGPTFEAWANVILGRYATERHDYTRLSVPVESGAHIPKLAALQPFDAVAIRHDGHTQVVRPRVIKHTIAPGSGGWVCELDASVYREQVYWLPPVPSVPEPPVHGGFYNHPGASRYDGGTPDSPGIGHIDGGTY